MRFLFLNHLQNAHHSLKANRFRSFLTMLGITIGVASIVTILALSAGANQIVNNQVAALGGNIAVIRPGNATENPLGDIAQLQSRHNYATSTLTEIDLKEIQSLKEIEAVAPLMVLSGAVKADSPAPIDTPIVATTPELQAISDIKVREGQFIDPNVIENATVIGPQLSINIFGTEESIGKTLTVRGESFTVIGILERTNNPINYNAIDFDNAVIISVESGRKVNQGATQIQQINVRSTSVANLDQAKSAIQSTLEHTHLGEKDFTVLSGEQIAQPTNQLFYAIAGVTTAIAGISLLVGGIGIMNIMLVGVAERTREIGIRKAVGASNGDIIVQFLIESVVLSIIGGIIGYIVGYLLAFGISSFLTFDPVIDWQIAVAALGLSLVVGTLFGLYPAIRAARKDPINALRQYD